MSEKGYFVSSGSYSDYRVVALFSSREKAEAFVAADITLGTEYRNEAGEWAPSQYGNSDYEIEEADLDVVFGATGCFRATVTIENTHKPQSTNTYGSRPRPVSAYWVEDVEADAPATAERSAWDGSTEVIGYGATREAAFAAADALRTRILSGEVDPPYPEWYQGPR